MAVVLGALGWQVEEDAHHLLVPLVTRHHQRRPPLERVALLAARDARVRVGGAARHDEHPHALGVAVLGGEVPRSIIPCWISKTIGLALPSTA